MELDYLVFLDTNFELSTSALHTRILTIFSFFGPFLPLEIAQKNVLVFMLSFLEFVRKQPQKATDLEL